MIGPIGDAHDTLHMRQCLVEVSSEGHPGQYTHNNGPVGDSGTLKAGSSMSTRSEGSIISLPEGSEERSVQGRDGEAR